LVGKKPQKRRLEQLKTDNLEAKKTLSSETYFQQKEKEWKQKEMEWKQKEMEFNQKELEFNQKIQQFEERWMNRYNTEEKRVEEIKLIAKEEMKPFYEDTKKEISNKERKSLKNLKNFSVDKWISNRNQVLVAFLQELTKTKSSGNLDNNEKKHVKKLCLIMRAIETIMKARNLNYVSEFGEALAALEYAISGSKLVIDMEGHTSANGSYMTLMKTIITAIGKELEIPSGDVMIAFDNEQKLLKAWLSGEMLVDALTMIICAKTNDTGQLQQNSTFKPENWSKPLTEDQKKTFHDLPEDVELAGKENLKQDLQEYINILKKEKEEGSKVIDSLVNDIIAEKDNKHKCFKCQQWYNKRTQKCPKCKISIKQTERKMKATMKQEQKEKKKETDTKQQSSKWFTYLGEVKTNPNGESFVAMKSKEMEMDQPQSKPTANSPPISLMEPVFVNPNSFKSITEILRFIGKKAGIKQYGGNLREWITIICDGLPYSLVAKVIETTMDEKGNKEFGWVHLLPGLLHEEMNMLKAYIELNWNIMYSVFGNEMGFQSGKAQAFFKSAGDHHKAWYNLCIYRDALALELLRPYTINCVENGIEPTVDGFFTWKEECKDPTYQFHCEQLLRYLQAIVTFWKGARENNY
jgi:hypothetical protein